LGHNGQNQGLPSLTFALQSQSGGLIQLADWKSSMNATLSESAMTVDERLTGLESEVSHVKADIVELKADVGRSGTISRHCRST
jgi:hypothetical protein